MATVLQDVKRRVFWVIARTCFAAYRHFPLFGTLRASIGIIGLCLPGGISNRNEAEIETLRREVLEETGLTVMAQELKLKYFSDADVPCNISVFEVQASGEVRNSWEGSPQWNTVAEVEARLMPSQQPVLELLKAMAAREQMRPRKE